MKKNKKVQLEVLIKENPFLPPSAYFVCELIKSDDDAELITCVKTSVSKRLNTKNLILDPPYKHISKIY